MKLFSCCLAIAGIAAASSAMADLPPPPGSPYPSRPPAVASALDAMPRFAKDPIAQINGNRAQVSWMMPDGIVCSATLTFDEPIKSQMEIDYDRDIQSGKMRSPPLIPFPRPAWKVNSLSCQAQPVQR